MEHPGTYQLYEGRLIPVFVNFQWSPITLHLHNLTIDPIYLWAGPEAYADPHDKPQKGAQTLCFIVDCVMTVILYSMAKFRHTTCNFSIVMSFHVSFYKSKFPDLNSSPPLPIF